MNAFDLLGADSMTTIRSFDQHWVYAFCAAFGTISAAIAGSTASCRVRMDIFGFIICGAIAALGGGTLRDLLLTGCTRADGTPIIVYWVSAEEAKYMYYALITSLVMFYLTRFVKPPAGTIRVADAFAMAFFTIIGTAKSFYIGIPWPISVLMGMCTGVAGGALRDVLTGNVPYVFRPGELYATASIVGGLAFIALIYLNVPYPIAFISGVVIAFSFRMAAVYLNWMLPSYRPLFDYQESGAKQSKISLFPLPDAQLPEQQSKPQEDTATTPDRPSDSPDRSSTTPDRPSDSPDRSTRDS